METAARVVIADAPAVKRPLHAGGGRGDGSVQIAVDRFDDNRWSRQAAENDPAGFVVTTVVAVDVEQDDRDAADFAGAG
jgi:hypothetical protein